jgi:signal transduction histidine kinase
MRRKLLFAITSVIVCSVAAFSQGQFGTAVEAKAMLEKAVTAVKADKAKALDMFQKGEGGFKDRDLYAFCANAGDGVITAHPTLKGQNMRELKDKSGQALGEAIMKAATEGKFDEVSYTWPRPGTDTTPVQKVSFVTKVADQVCAVGYYK